MANEQLFDDLKQFIETAVSQHLDQFATKDDLAHLATTDDVRKLESRIDRLKYYIDLVDQKLDQVQDAIGETFTHTTEDVSRVLGDHDHRLTKLEQQAA